MLDLIIDSMILSELLTRAYIYVRFIDKCVIIMY